MTEACERWVAITDREALDEPVTDAERAFRIRHAAACRDCAREAALFRELGGEIADVSDAPSERLDRVLVAVRGDSSVRSAARLEPPAAHRSRWARVGPRTRLVLSGVAAAAALASLLSFAELAKEPAFTPAPLARVVLTFVSEGDAKGRPLGGELGRGAVVRTTTGPACLSVEPGVNACAGENSEVRVAETVLENRTLELTRGKVVVSLQKQPPGTSFSVTTAHGRVTATGTVFSVELTATTTLVRVAEGSVVTQAHGAAIRPLHENQTLVLGSAVVRPLAREEAGRDRALVAKSAPQRNAEPVAREALLPANEPIAPAMPHTERAPRKEEPTRPVEAPDAATHPENDAAPAPASQGSSAAFPDQPTETRPESRSAVELLRSARALREQGRLREAADSYLRLQSLYPNSAAAMASYVSLGDVNLALGDAAGALAAFDAYLRGRGPLAQEARYGRIRALILLGRAAEAERDSEEFLRLYPNSVQARSLRKPR